MENPISYTVNLPLPNEYHEYYIFKFIESTSNILLKALVKQYDLSKFYPPEIIQEIQKKIKLDEKYKNPLNFEKEFNNDFDYIAIDFETANNKRISACALGIVFVKDGKIADKESNFIKPPEGETFNSRHINIHGIKPEDIELSLNFKQLWDVFLKHFFNNNLIVLHNSSMDASIIKQLVYYYNIQDYKVKYIDTMQLAKRYNYPGKLIELCNLFDISLDNHHDPEDDAKACAFIYKYLKEKHPNAPDISKTISPDTNKSIKSNFFREKAQKGVSEQESVKLIDIANKYLLDKEMINALNFKNQKVLITGTFQNISRSEIKRHITEQQGIIVSGISKSLNYVIMGENFGPSKAKKIEEYNSKRYTKIKILREDDFLKKINNL